MVLKIRHVIYSKVTLLQESRSCRDRALHFQSPHSYESGFLSLSTTETWGIWIILCCGAVLCIVRCLQHPWPLLARSQWHSLPQPVTTKSISRHCQMAPGEDHSHDSVSGLGGTHFYMYWGHRSIDSRESVPKLALPNRWAHAAASSVLGPPSPSPGRSRGTGGAVCMAPGSSWGHGQVWSVQGTVPPPRTLDSPPYALQLEMELFVPQLLKLIT